MDHSTNETSLECLKEKIASGDQKAFRELFMAYCGRLTQFAFSIVKSRDAAREITDEVFIKLWRNKINIGNIRNLKVYLYTAAKNTALNYLSVNARNNITQSFDLLSVQLIDDQSPERKLINSEILTKINAAIENLPPRCKMVFKLVREDGLSYKDAGEILNISPKTVDAQMVIAVKAVSEEVKTEFDIFPPKKIKKNS
jgi:RNA polymerase sigma-70 factor (ECF subfamily)